LFYSDGRMNLAGIVRAPLCEDREATAAAGAEA
jgi:hypothetical protein